MKYTKITKQDNVELLNRLGLYFIADFAELCERDFILIAQKGENIYIKGAGANCKIQIYLGDLYENLITFKFSINTENDNVLSFNYKDFLENSKNGESFAEFRAWVIKWLKSWRFDRAERKMRELEKSALKEWKEWNLC